MACLKNNGTKVFETPAGALFMSNGVVLKRRPGGGFKVIGKAKKGFTFATLAGLFEKAGRVIEWHAPEWRDLQPAPTIRTMRPAPATARQAQWVDRRNPGLLRAKAKQGVK